MKSLVVAALALASLAGCGASSASGCKDTEVEVDYLGGGARDGQVVCEPKPSVCGTPASCADTPCIAAMYAFCESPYIGVGCSDTFAPPIISCNP